MKEIFILMADGDGTMRSSDQPIGSAVTTEEEAKKFVSEAKVGYTHSYQKITIHEKWGDALRAVYPHYDEWAARAKENR